MITRDGVVAGGGTDGRPGNSGAMARIRSVLSAVGAVLTGTGVLILLFVAYQLWGTGLYTARAQDALKDEFEAKIAAPGPDTTTGTAAAATTTTNAVASVVAPPPPSGEAVAVIRIPRIGVDQAVVEGVSVADLRKGPGHYPSTPLPGEAGNAAIAGHRTTYGAPFNRLDELAAGDEILVTTQRGNSTYRVLEKKIVGPDQVEVLDPTPEPRLTLTTCHPKYSAAKRLILVAGLAPGETATPPSPRPPPPPPDRRRTLPTSWPTPAWPLTGRNSPPWPGARPPPSSVRPGGGSCGGGDIGRPTSPAPWVFSPSCSSSTPTSSCCFSPTSNRRFGLPAAQGHPSSTGPRPMQWTGYEPAPREDGPLSVAIVDRVATKRTGAPHGQDPGLRAPLTEAAWSR